MNIDATAGYTTARAAQSAARLQRLTNELERARDNPLRERVGEFVGQFFYGTLLKQMQQSKLKGKYFHGGRGEEVFQMQLGMELAMRAGRSPNDPVAGRIYDAFVERHAGLQSASEAEATRNNKRPGA
ncbi:MAG: hypothetical protein ACE5F9_02385 [Phycisphaerae bacterium]